MMIKMWELDHTTQVVGQSILHQGRRLSRRQVIVPMTIRIVAENRDEVESSQREKDRREKANSRGD
jgi:hypothetical protein